MSPIRVPLFLKLQREYASVSDAGVSSRLLHARPGSLCTRPGDRHRTAQLPTAIGLGTHTARFNFSDVAGVDERLWPLPNDAAETGSGGVARPSDLIKVLLAGADASAVVSAVYREAPDAIPTMLDGIRQFMSANRFRSLNKMKSRRSMEFSSVQEGGFAIQHRTQDFNRPSDWLARSMINADQWDTCRSRAQFTSLRQRPCGSAVVAASTSALSRNSSRKMLTSLGASMPN